jgi:hypothetical protein
VTRLRILLPALAVAAISGIAVPVASAAFWSNEAALLNETGGPARTTYIIDAGSGHRIGRSIFLANPYLSFYERHGFDRNFFTWAPLTTIDDGYAITHKWTACRNPPGNLGPTNGLQTLEPDGLRLCIDSAVATDADPVATIRTDIGSGPLEGFVAGDAFVSDVCGNWSGPANSAPHPPPVPTISGSKYEDLNANGVRDPNEPGLAAWTIKLFYNGAFVASTPTAYDGSYSFLLDADSLPIGGGTYSLQEVPQDGWTQSQSPPSLSIGFGVGGATFSGNDFGNWRPASISGRKFEDMNADSLGVADPGVEGWAIGFAGHSAGSVNTGLDGTYSISGLAPGTYTVSEGAQFGWYQSFPGGLGSYTITVQSGDTVTGYDFGNWRPATITGRKFDDHAVDGTGAGDPGLAGWTIALDNGVSTTTGLDGSYSLTGLKPGRFVVGEQQQDGWRQSAPTGTTSVTLTSGETLGNIDFGNVCLGKIAVTVPAGVGIRIDEVNVGGFLSNDPLLPRTASGASTISGLLPGTYRVMLTLPDGTFSTDPDLTAIGAGFAIVKTVSVAECGTTVVAPQFVTSQPGKITGGIRILVAGGFATGGFEFMQSGAGPRGTLEYNDHASGLRIHTSDITGISVSGTDAYIFGHVAVGTSTYSFRLHLFDAGEPGTSDRFEFVIANGYSAGLGEALDGGNVQLH